MKIKPEVRRNESLLPKHKYLVCKMVAGVWEVVAADTGLWEAHQKMEPVALENPRESFTVLYIEDIVFV